MSTTASDREPGAIPFCSVESFTEREDALGSAKSKAAFLSNIGQEIRTPLNGVLGIASMLKLTELDSTQRRYVDTIEKSSEALMGVLSNLVVFAHLEAGMVSLESGPIQIDELARSALATVQSAAEAKGIRLRSELGEGADSIRRGDRAKVIQVLTHLLNNAVKFTQGGTVCLSVDRIGRDEDGLFRLTVGDTGIGMSLSDLNAVLQGVSSPRSSDSPHSGAGLGLLIADKLARQMGGRIVGSSQPGIGSQFALELTMGPNLAAPDPTVRAASGELLGLKVLAFEDNSATGDMLGAYLARGGAHVTAISDGPRAVSATATQHFDVILVDLEVREVDAIQVTRAIRDLGCEKEHIPIIGVSSGLSELDRWACRQSGMNDFIFKPLDSREIVDTLLKWLPTKSNSSMTLGRPA